MSAALFVVTVVAVCFALDRWGRHLTGRDR